MLRGCEFVALDASTDSVRNYHPTGQGVKRPIGTAVNVTAASWTVATRRITCVTSPATFVTYTVTTGDIFWVLSGTGWTPGPYVIESKVTNNVIVLVAAQGQPTANNTDTLGFILPVDSVLGYAGDTAIHGIIVTTSDPSALTIDIKAMDTGVIVHQFPVPALISTPYPIPTGSASGVKCPKGFTTAISTGGTTLAATIYFSRTD